MKCWNSAFNAQGLRAIIVSSCTGRSSENIWSSSGGGGAEEKGKRGDETHSVYRQNWWKN